MEKERTKQRTPQSGDERLFRSVNAYLKKIKLEYSVSEKEHRMEFYLPSPDKRPRRVVVACRSEILFIVVPEFAHVKKANLAGTLERAIEMNWEMWVGKLSLYKEKINFSYEIPIHDGKMHKKMIQTAIDSVMAICLQYKDDLSLYKQVA